MAYLERIVDAELQERLSSSGAVLIEGPRACGKTETGKRAAASTVLLDTDKEAQSLLALDPNLLLEGNTPRLIDEWQIAPELWNYVRRAVDERQAKGQFILTGSAVPPDDATRHSGAGRFSRLRMRPLSFYEAGHSTGAISLKGLLQGEPARSPDTGLSPTRIAELIVRGGWPENQGGGEQTARRFTRDYLTQISRVDIRQADAAVHDPAKVTALIASLARNTASEVSISTLRRDTSGTEPNLLAHTTVTSYLSTLERVFMLVNQPAWRPRIRSRATLREAPKRHLVDPSLAAAALGASSDRLIRDLETMGLLFESLVYRDLLTYSQPLDAEVFHYRDSYGLEVDAIVQLPDGQWGAFEVKLNPGSVDDAARNLNRFAEKVDTTVMQAPRVLGVIVATKYGYVRDDGIAVIPVGALGP